MKYAMRKFFSLECLEMAISYPQSLIVNIRISFRNYHTIVLHIVLWKNEKFGLTDKIFRQINYVVIFFSEEVAFTNFLPKKRESKLT